MIHDTSRLANDINTIVGTLFPEVDMMKLTIRMEEVLSNYQIHRKTVIEVEEDLPEKVELYLSTMRLEGLSGITLSDYKMELNLFIKHCNKSTAQVNTSDIRSYLSSIENVTMSTIGKKLMVLKSFFGWLVKEEIILRNPTVKVKTPKTPKRLPKGLSIEEIEIVRESCDTLKNRALMEVLYSTACRLSEVVNINRDDIDVQNMSINVIGKGDKERTVYLSSKAMYHLDRYLGSRNSDDVSESLFATTRRPYRRMSARAIQNEIGKIRTNAKLSKHFTVHSFRHSAATNMLSNGAELADIQQILGHVSPDSTLIYAHVSEERKKSAHRRFHSQ